MHHITIHKEKSNKMQQCIKVFIILYLYETQHVSGDKLPIIRSLKLHRQPLVFHTGKVVGRVVWWTLSSTVCQCSFRLLMMGGVSPETSWASYKNGIIKILIHFCILLDFLYELYYDARIHKHRINKTLCNSFCTETTPYLYLSILANT